MNLGILLPLGESLSGMREHGQDVRFVKYYLSHYSKHFAKIFIFSYAHEVYANLPSNCQLVCPSKKIHRYIYGPLLPFIKRKYFAKCDVFRCFHPSAAIPAVVAKIFFRKKFVFNYNYDYKIWARIEGKKWFVPLISLSNLLIFKLADHVFVSDEKMQAHAKKFVSETKTTLIRNAVDTNSFKPQPKKNHPKKLVLSVGRLEKQKNYALLIDAISHLNQKTKLLIVGKGSLKEELLKKARGKNVNLEIIDVVPNDKLPQIYNSADIYVQPSLVEAPVKTLLEAMSCGLPCVATDVPGISDVIQNGDNGLLAKLTANDIAAKIDYLLKNSKFAHKIAASARNTIIQKYNLSEQLALETKILTSL